MGKKYSTVLTGGVINTYSDDNPADDGSKTADNRVKYSRIKSDLTAPLHSGIVNMDGELLQIFDTDAVAKSANYTTVESDYMKPIEATGASTTISLLDPSGNDGYATYVKNANAAGGDTITVDVDGGSLVDGQTNITLAPKDGPLFAVDAAGTGYIRLGHSEPFESGTVALFVQATAPTGWTIGAGTYNNRKVVIDDSNGTTTGGSVSAVAAFDSGSGGANHTHTGTASGTTGGGSAHTHTGPSHTHASGSLATGNESAHTHGAGTYAAPRDPANDTGCAAGAFQMSNNDHNHDVTGTSGAGSAHNHSVSGNTGSGGTGSTGSESSHTHSFSDSFTTSTASATAHTHSVSSTNFVKVITATKD